MAMAKAKERTPQAN